MSLESVSSSDSVFDESHNTSQASISTHNTRNGSNCTSGFHSYPNTCTSLSTDSSCIPNSPTQFKFPPLNHKRLSRPHSSTEQFPKLSRRQSTKCLSDTRNPYLLCSTFWSDNCHLQNPSLSQEITFSKRLDSNEYPSGGLWKLPAPVKQGPNQPIRLQQSRRSSEGHVAKIQPIRSHVGNQPFEYHQQTEMMNLGRHLSFPTSPVNNLSLQNISSNRLSLGSGLGPSLGSGLGPSLEPGLGPSLEPSLGPRLRSGLGPRLGPGLGPSLGPSLGSGLGPSSRHSAEPGLGPSLVSFMYESKTQPHHSTSRKISLTTSTPEKWTASRTSCDKIVSPSDHLLRCDLTQYRCPFQSETLPNIMHNKSHDKGKKSHDKGNNRTEHSRNPGQTDVIFEDLSFHHYYNTGQTRFTEPHTHTSVSLIPITILVPMFPIPILHLMVPIPIYLMILIPIPVPIPIYLMIFIPVFPIPILVPIPIYTMILIPVCPAPILHLIVLIPIYLTILVHILHLMGLIPIYLTILIPMCPIPILHLMGLIPIYPTILIPMCPIPILHLMGLIPIYTCT